MKDTHLICTKCEKKYPTSQIYPRCEICNEPLEAETVTRGCIREGNILRQTFLERYADFFPFVDADDRLTLSEGFTPLINSRRIASHLGIKNTLFKNETQNPTWSFKDRGTLVGVHHAVRLGYERIGTVSSGNMAVSVAAYGTKAGLRTFALVDAGIPGEKLNPIAIYNPVLIQVDGDYGDLYYQSLEIGKKTGVYFINSDVPFRVEGSKSIAFEICEQMNFQVPDYVVIPTSSGGNFRGILKGFREFHLCGLIDKLPTMVCAQAQGCSPIHRAWANGDETIARFENPETIAHAIENPYPPSGNEVLRKMSEYGGICVAVNDEEILEAQLQLAREGIFGQPAAAVPLASVRKMRDTKIVGRNDTVVCIVTGGGLKYTAVYEKYELEILHCKPEELDTFISKWQ